MKMIGLTPTYYDSPLDALWREVVKLYPSSKLYGPGYLDMPSNESADFVLCADPGRKGSRYWDLSRIDAPVKAVVLQDACYGVSKHMPWILEQGINLILVRGKDDIPAVARSLAEAIDILGAGQIPRVAWLPFGLDPEVFHPYSDVSITHDVAIFGHGRGPYTTRDTTAILLAKYCHEHHHSFKSYLLDGCESPKLTGVDYARAMSTARVIVVTPPSYGYVVQKYYEVGGVHRALLCIEPRHGFSDLGFQRDVHYKSFELGPDLEELGLNDSLDELLSGGTWMTYAKKLHELVMSYHTNAHRVATLLELVSSVSREIK